MSYDTGNDELNESLDRLRDRYEAMFNDRHSQRTRTNSLLDAVIRVLKVSQRAGREGEAWRRPPALHAARGAA